MLHLVRDYRVGIDFKNYPHHPLDKTLFSKPAFALLQQDGFLVSPLKIMHNASIHYATRYDSSPLRTLNALLEIGASFPPNWSKVLKLSDRESSELQGKSSEVIAVGLCIGVTSQLFNINKNRINPILQSGKRCDYRFEKQGLEYRIESKGRKESSQMKAAVKDIFAKKAHSHALAPKYGFLSYLPRDGIACTMEVMDPPYEPESVSPKERAVYLLTHYAAKAHLAGFWRLAKLLHKRKIHLQRGGAFEDINNSPLEYSNVVKMGESIELELADGKRYLTFFSPDNLRAANSTAPRLVAALEHGVVEMLEAQNFKRLFSSFRQFPDITDILNQTSFNSDGSVLMLSPRLHLPPRRLFSLGRRGLRARD